MSTPMIGPRDQLRRPLRDLRISLLDQCNFRCTYCMPVKKFHENYQFLTKNERLNHEEIIRLVKIVVPMGVSKIRLTGGEPLLDKNVAQLVEKINQIEGIDDLALTTNATLLKKKAQDLANAGLDRITISLDSIDQEIFYKMNGNRGNVSDVIEGIEAAEKAGLLPIKINTVVQRGVNEHTIIDLLEHFKGSGHIVRLIEFMDVGNQNNWNLKDVVSAKELLTMIQNKWSVSPVDKAYRGEVAKRYSYDDGSGEIGFITSVSKPFCGDCSRARLSADGVLYTCLFANHGTDIKELLRGDASDREIHNLFSKVWMARNDRYSETRKSYKPDESLKKIEMYRMGG
ncbi:GTP 3',8-cyclase MoaA [Woeseiaceae bacterium]|nr:GTP 3',8-cyclase MoaA [Woeseiaceae bacterium]